MSRHYPAPGKHPSRWQLKQMAMNGVASTSDGCRILDLTGSCEHGAPSWLLSVLPRSPRDEGTREAEDQA